MCFHIHMLTHTLMHAHKKMHPYLFKADAFLLLQFIKFVIIFTKESVKVLYYMDARTPSSPPFLTLFIQKASDPPPPPHTHIFFTRCKIIFERPFALNCPPHSSLSSAQVHHCPAVDQARSEDHGRPGGLAVHRQGARPREIRWICQTQGRPRQTAQLAARGRGLT